MASHIHNIDETQLICSNSNFKLRTKCSIKLFSPHGHLFPFSFIFQTLNRTISYDIWVAGRSTLEFSVLVSGIDFSSQNFDQIALAESLRETICGTEVAYWLMFHAELADRFNTRSGPI